jgi:tRNA-uridine 2-sulfurtransferase
MDQDLTGFEGLSAGARVVVAMSGGVDSSAVAARAKALGFTAIGITLQLYDHGQAVRRKGACCAGEDIHDARRVADGLGIAHYVLDFEARFKSAVMQDFAQSYAAGRTPVPCVRCNSRVKFPDLIAIARELGAAALLTGHYARRVPGPQGAELHAAADPARDQSYFLFATRQEELDYLRFPLGHLMKPDVRRLAEAAGLAVAAKPDSQDICFVPQGRYAAVIERLKPGAAEPGPIVDLEGRVLGTHPGIIHFTVGQRRGLGLAGGEPLFVVALDAARRQVIVGPRAALACHRFGLEELNVLAGPADLGAGLAAKVRSTRAPVPAQLILGPDGAAAVEIPGGEEGVAPGQACVLYRGPRVIGGGFIARTDRLAPGLKDAARLSA